MKYGSWTTVESVPPRKGSRHTSIYLFVRCICGEEKFVSKTSLSRGDSKSCGCMQKYARLRPYESLFRSVGKSAARRGNTAVELSYEEFLEFCKQTECHYCNAPITWTMYGYNYEGRSGAYNLDRKNNVLGYSKENCVVCCRACNHGKGSIFTYEEWCIMTEALRRFRHGNNTCTYAAAA